MKTKLSNILGVGLALLMVFSLAFALMPTKAQADEGNMTWLQQPLPGTGDANGNVLLSDPVTPAVLALGVTEVAVANDGKTIYAITNTQVAGIAAAPFALYKSIDAGQSWRGINLSVPIPVATWTNSTLGNVAVAPDNPEVVAISTFDVGTTGEIDTVFVSSSGGISWAPLPPTNIATGANAANLRIMDLKVGPARLDAILQREYLIAVADDFAPGVAPIGYIGGGLQIIGAAEAWGATGTTWADLTDAALPPATTVGAADFMACEFSPAYLGARTVIGIGAALTAIPAAPPLPAVLVGSSVYVFNTQSDTLLNAAGSGDLLDALAREYAGAAPNSVLRADIALSTDFDFATPGYDKIYASLAYNAAGISGGIYRTEQGLPVSPILANTQAIRSIAYAGDAFGGTLFSGDWATTVLTTRVRYTTQPVINNPTWYPSRKSPTGTGGQGYVRLSPNFLADQTVYCGTISAATGGEGAFSVSTDAGISFNQEALIDSIGGLPANLGNTVVSINSIAYAPDGTTLFLATDDAPTAAGALSLWKTATPATPWSWVRIYCFTKAVGASTGVLTINRGLWADFPEIYFAESPTVALRFYVSTDGGALWASRTAPVIGQVIPAGGIATAGPKELYVAFGAAPNTAANISKSVSGAAGAWGPPIPGNAGAGAVSVAVAPNGDVLVGGFGGTSRSTDGGTTFVPIANNNGLPATGVFATLPDYMGNYPIAYTWSLGGAPNNVFRIDVDTGTVWENLANPGAAALVGFGQSNGALYAMTAGASPGACDRTIMPTFAVGDMLWGTMNVPAGSFPNGASLGLTDVADSKAYSCFTDPDLPATPIAPELWAYNDVYATAKSTINTPASGATISIDPVTGRADTLQFSWSAVGVGTGLGTNYFIAIFEKSQGFPGAIIQATGAMPLPSSPSNAIYPAAVATATPPDLNYTFLAGNEYGIMISALNQVSGDSFTAIGGPPPVVVPTDLMFSAWSDPIFISIEAGSGVISPPHGGPLLNAPSLNATATGVDVGLSWAPMSGVTAYEVIVSTNADLSAPIISETLGTTSFGITLDFDTVYYYGVRATAPTSSVQATDTFTLAKPIEKYTCPQCGLTFDTRAELEAHIAAAHAPATPLYIWIVIAIGAILVIAVIWLIFTTRKA